MLCVWQLKRASRALSAIRFGAKELRKSSNQRDCFQQASHMRWYWNGRNSRYEQQYHNQEDRADEPQWEYRPKGPSGGRVLLLRPTLWALAFSAGVFYVSSDSYVEHQEKLQSSSQTLLSFWGFGAGSDDEEARVWALMSDGYVQRLVGRSHAVYGVKHARAIRRIARLPEWVPFELKRTTVALADRWYSLSPGARCVYALAGVNTLVFGMWQIPRLLPFMARCFLHDPRTGLSYTMLTSTFSHREIWHFLFNNIALVSFGTGVANAIGAEQFSAFYLSAGVFSSLASHLLAPLRPALILPSLGASGAVYSVIGATMLLFPHTKIALIFLPFIPFTLTQAFPVLMAYDFAGAVLGWQTFNHIAHFAGGLYGLAYTQWGLELWARLVRAMKARQVRSKPSN